MRRLAVLAVLTVLAGGWYLLHDIGHIPLFDANLNRLAETPREGYCAGIVFWSNSGKADAEQAAACREESDRSDDPDLKQVVTQFCVGVVEEGYAGGLAYAWNRANPYPGDRLLVVTVPSDSRTGEREGFNR